MLTREELSLHGGLGRRGARQTAVLLFSAHVAAFNPPWLAPVSYSHHSVACLNLHTLQNHALCQEQVQEVYTFDTCWSIYLFFSLFWSLFLYGAPPTV